MGGSGPGGGGKSTAFACAFARRGDRERPSVLARPFAFGFGSGCIGAMKLSSSSGAISAGTSSDKG